MTYLTAAVVALALVTTFNTVLCFAVIRRLRSAPPPGPESLLDAPVVGTTVADFTTLTTAGASIGPGDLDDSVVLFLSPRCPPCAQARADLVEMHPADERVFVFVPGHDEHAPDFAATLPEWVTTAVVGQPVLDAFGGLSAYPTVLRVRGGVVTHNVPAVEDVLAVPSSHLH